MSIHSDVEMISIQAMEKYASRNKITAKEVSRIFHEHQVFEKIILQYEYLISEETYNFDSAYEYALLEKEQKKI